MTAVDDPVIDAEGAGVLSSWADLATALSAEQVDPHQAGFAAAGAGLDTLGAWLRPFDALLRAGLGWIVEHIAFLREPLDVLAGDPDGVLAQARHWDGAATELRAAAEDLRTAVPPGWDGAAADGYRLATVELAGAMHDGADQAAALAELIMVTGAAVGTVRALVRDAVAGFVAAVLEYLLTAAAMAALTAAGSLAGVVIAVVARAVALAQSIARRLRQLLDRLAAAGGAAGRIGAALQRSAARIRDAQPGLSSAGAAVQRYADAAYAPVVVEAGKQLSDARQRREAWREHNR